MWHRCSHWRRYTSRLIVGGYTFLDDRTHLPDLHIIMGCITGSAGGVIRDVLLNNEPVIFRKEIYALACILGGCIYWILIEAGIPLTITTAISFAITCLVRFLSVRYKISLPILYES